MTKIAETIRDYYNPRIQFSPPKIELIAGLIAARGPGCNVLVFGVGNDSVLFSALNRDGNTVFVEDKDVWVRFTGNTVGDATVLLQSYGDYKVSNSLPIDEDRLASHPIPDYMRDADWDIIIVDAPDGSSDRAPGRALPLYWTSQIATAKTHVFVDDCERELERTYALHLFDEQRKRRGIDLPSGPRQLTRWYMAASDAFSGHEILDHQDKRQRLKTFLSCPDLKIVMLHDGYGFMPELATAPFADDSYHYMLSSSWYASPKTYAKHREALDRAADGRPDWIERHVTILANSAEEAETARGLFPPEIVRHVNNAALLDTELFDLREEERRYDAVLNAKPYEFKRHHLAADVARLALVTYGSGGKIDLDSIGAAEIIRDIPPQEVARVNARAGCGLALSAEEGACYASLEYLLCGLPVVSTPSRGGRDDFYDETNSLICDPDPAAVTQAVAEMIARDPDRAAIRENALHKVQAFRKTLSDRLGEIYDRHGIASDPALHLRVALKNGNKLQSHRNFWTRRLAD